MIENVMTKKEHLTLLKRCCFEIKSIFEHFTVYSQHVNDRIGMNIGKNHTTKTKHEGPPPKKRKEKERKLTVHPNTLGAASVCDPQQGGHKSHGSGLRGMASCLVWRFPTW